MNTRSGRLTCRSDFLANLRGVAKDKFGSDRRDAIGAPKRRLQVDALAIAEVFFEFAHDGDIRSGEPENSLPIVADCEQLRFRRLLKQRLQQARPRGRNVLELIDEDVAVGLRYRPDVTWSAALLIMSWKSICPSPERVSW